MGSRKITLKTCPKCGKHYEVYDSESSMMYVAKCDCGFDEEMAYIEINGCTFLIPVMVKEFIDEMTEDDSYRYDDEGKLKEE
jgi:hypothetical protein